MSILSIRKQVSTETSDIDYRFDVCEKAVATLTLHSNSMIPGRWRAARLFSQRDNGKHIAWLLPQLIGIKLVQDSRTNS